MKKQGKISVTTENIFPIIRQWLYSSQDIFLREIISNAADAITKRKHLASIGEVPAMEEEPAIHILLNEKKNTLTVSDNGIGMTAEEVDKYINEIAYSGLVDFVEKYQKDNTKQAQIIGHFGLGFYSSFMIADKVEIESLSAFAGTEAVRWESEEGIEFTMDKMEKTQIGTNIVMHMTEEAAKEYSSFKLKHMVQKYCHFLQYPIYFDVISNQDQEKTEEPEAEKNLTPINNTNPLWNKKPSQVEEQEYLDFYQEMFPGTEAPLFWVHLNLDYPFQLKGILYFPKIDLKYEQLEGRIKVYYNQVFVADNVPEIIPDFLFLLKGCIDCPDLPLNVSRSFLQDDQYVKKLSSHIVKKVADRLIKVAKDQPEEYANWWQYLQLFVKYGMLKDSKFAEKVYDYALLKDTDGEYQQLNDIAEGTVYYTPGENSLLPYVDMAKKQDQKVYVLSEDIDVQWMSFIEYHSQGKLKFTRVDSMNENGEDKAVEETDREALQKAIESLELSEYDVKYQHIGEDALPILIRENEEYRRMKELLKQIEASGDQATIDSFKNMFAQENQKPYLIINLDQPVLQTVTELEDAQAKEFVNYLYQLAKLGQGELEGQDLIEFLGASTKYAFESNESRKQ